jgi:hypothetical protein
MEAITTADQHFLLGLGLLAFYGVIAIGLMGRSFNKPKD